MQYMDNTARQLNQVTNMQTVSDVYVLSAAVDIVDVSSEFALAC